MNAKQTEIEVLGLTGAVERLPSIFLPETEAPNTPDQCQSLSFCHEGGAVTPFNNILRPWQPHCRG